MTAVNKQAPVFRQKEIMINAGIEKVWGILTDIDKWTNWNTDISYAKLNGELAVTTTFDWKTGGSKIHSKLHTIAPLSHFGWTGKALGAYAIHNWTLTNINGGTKVYVEESMEGFLAGLLKKMLNKNLETQMQNWLDLLKKESEG